LVSWRREGLSEIVQLEARGGEGEGEREGG